jgi:NADH-quinone oxidoreductase subunit J
LITQTIFMIFAGLALTSAILVVLQKNAMHSVLYLAFTVLSIGGVFFCLQAEYLGAIQILVYGGGIVVLYVFVIIIVNLNEITIERRKLFPKLFIVAVPALLFVQILNVMLTNRPTAYPGSERSLEFRALARMLFSTYLIPFEIASILLLAVLVGAIIIARRRLLHDPD